MSFSYENLGFASLNVNLNRQQYGPLDISTVFTCLTDLDWYASSGTNGTTPSEYWADVVPYPYAGQLVSVVTNNTVNTYILLPTGETKNNKATYNYRNIREIDEGELT